MVFYCMEGYTLEQVRDAFFHGERLRHRGHCSRGEGVDGGEKHKDAFGTQAKVTEPGLQA